MSKFSKVKNLFAVLITLNFINGCSKSDNIIAPDLISAPQQNEFISSSATSNLPVLVAFNNAYRITTEENEAIGRQTKNNPEKYFLGLLKSAKTSIDGAFYDIDDMEA